MSDKPTYEELLAENTKLRAVLLDSVRPKQDELTPDLGDMLTVQADQLTLRLRIKAEAYEHRIYELEMAFLLAPVHEGQAHWDRCERVKANYQRDYPDRPLHPKPRPNPADSYQPTWHGPPPKPPKTRKPCTKRTP